MLTKHAVLLLFFLSPTARAGAEDLNEELLIAARKSDALAVKALLAKGADVNAKTSYGVTALSFAADRGSLEIVKSLLEHGADVNATDTFYHKPFWQGQPARVMRKLSGHCWKEARLDPMAPWNGRLTKTVLKLSKRSSKRAR